ncbi:TetR/AcrR family transcriptional regulator [Mesoterricola silvestris]|uniref:HTH tetR-type domain-containing protein n=1 Tax=Mesoterricola silvestris TaxID=2927979 RepID=A0AA48GXA4_9BACT|nr:TetR/AcrR family transcriptional regulator [Mesoterricola silvestris]BDU73576.1 hypothetical protein METEAL_27500 [Mesoterricola silvestris]
MPRKPKSSFPLPAVTPPTPTPGARISDPGGSRKAARQTRSRDTVSAILEAAARILETKGYAAASTNAIARAAGVSVGSLYQYFADRDDVFRALAARHRAGIHPIIAGAIARMAKGDEPPARILTTLLEDLLEAHGDRPALMHSLETELARFQSPEGILAEAGKVEQAARILAARLPRPPAEALAHAWLATELTALVSRRLAHDPPAWADVAEVRAAYARALGALV